MHVLSTGPPPVCQNCDLSMSECRTSRSWPQPSLSAPSSSYLASRVSRNDRRAPSRCVLVRVGYYNGLVCYALTYSPPRAWHSTLDTTTHPCTRTFEKWTFRGSGMRIREPEPQRCVTRPREGNRPRAALVSGRSPGQRYAAVALGPNVPSQSERPAASHYR